MNIWIYILIFIDLVILVVAIAIYSKRDNYRDTAPVNDDLNTLIVTLQGIVDEAENVSKVLSQQIDKGGDVAAMINERSVVAANHAKKKEDISETSPLPPPYKAKYKEVARLARDGLSIKEISKSSGVPEGEVELIINLGR